MRLCIFVGVLTGLSIVSQTQSKFDIDDAILFRIDFPGIDDVSLNDLPKVKETSKLENDSSDEEGGLNNELLRHDRDASFGFDSGRESSGEHLEIVEIVTRNKENFRCSIPNTKSNLLENKESYNGPTVLSLFKPVFDSQGCVFRIEHYWTYELCHGKYLRQFHEERNGKKVQVSEYFLGRYTKEQFDADEAKLKIEMQEKSQRHKAKKLDGTDLPFFELVMKDGTICDLTERPRTTRVLYVCVPLANQEIISFREVSTCEYEVIVSSGVLCQHPMYRPVETQENAIVCKPLDKSSPKKPKDLLEIEKEGTIYRLKDLLTQEQIGKALKIEIIPSSSALESEEYNALLQVLKNNWNMKLPSKFGSNSKQIREFLSGENCLSSGSGWWKYELCYGQSVVQYHEGKDGDRETVIKLGRFSEVDHLEWIENHQEKQPRSLSQRKQVSHFYNQGDVCVETGKNRHVEVKLKCKPSEKSVSMYLLEPKTCEYILGVESQFICDILPFADDESGLIEASPEMFATSDQIESMFGDDFETPVTIIRFQIDDTAKNVPEDSDPEENTAESSSEDSDEQKKQDREVPSHTE